MNDIEANAAAQCGARADHVRHSHIEWRTALPTPSPILTAMFGTRSPTSLGASCLSGCAAGRMSSDKTELILIGTGVFLAVQAAHDSSGFFQQSFEIQAGDCAMHDDRFAADQHMADTGRA